MSDLVERLRDGWMSRRLNEEAADRIEALQTEREQILLEVFGGEDTPGFAASCGLKDVQEVMQARRSEWAEMCDRLQAAEALLREARWHIHLPNPDLIARIDTFLNGGAKS